ncbi:hypothetical protein CC86DRAFT_406750 [Ophiobolus disseminans]|uniref:Uncharacterized protein n=1 Tax=Ophiobolus disseminans TaxID=1469910 RepID=A0A6A7A1A8_9PLEO|nr:hypothetical protein CC86DRAFT_406750 [Ophiobolus disseminans]
MSEINFLHTLSPGAPQRLPVRRRPVASDGSQSPLRYCFRQHSNIPEGHANNMVTGTTTRMQHSLSSLSIPHVASPFSESQATSVHMPNSPLELSLVASNTPSGSPSVNADCSLVSPSSSSSSGNSALRKDDRMALPSQTFKSPSEPLDTNAQIPSQYGVGARMVHIAPSKSSGVLDVSEQPSPPSIIRCPSGVLSSQTNAGAVLNNQPFDAEQRRTHCRNKQTISNIFEIVGPNPSFSFEPIIADTPEMEHDSARSKLFVASPSKYESIKQTAIKRKPVKSPVPQSFAIQTVSQSLVGLPDFNMMQLSQGYLNLEDTFASDFGHNVSFDHRRSSSRSSSSTVEFECWNAEEQFEERPNSEHMLKRKACNYDLKNSAFSPISSTNPAEMSGQDVREHYSIQAFAQAGPEYGTSVHDFASVPAKPPVSDECLTNVLHAPLSHRSSASVTGFGFEYSDLIDLEHWQTDTISQEAISGELEARSDEHKDVDDTYILPATVYVPPKPDKLPVLKEKLFFVFDEESSPPRSPHAPPPNTAIRVIAEDAGSIMDGTNDVEEIEDAVVQRNSRSIVYDYDGLLNARDALNFSDGDDIFSVDSPTEEEDRYSRSHSRQSVHVPAFSGMRSTTEPTQSTGVHSTNDDGLLNRNFQFPTRSQEIQRVASAQLLAASNNDGVDVPSNPPKRRDSLRVRLFNKFKGKGAGKALKADDKPRKSLLRRGSARVVSFIGRRA